MIMEFKFPYLPKGLENTLLKGFTSDRNEK